MNIHLIERNQYLTTVQHKLLKGFTNNHKIMFYNIIRLRHNFAVHLLGGHFQKPQIIVDVDELESLADALFCRYGILDRNPAGFASPGTTLAKGL